MHIYTHYDPSLGQGGGAVRASARLHACLPEGYSKTALLNLVSKVAKPLGLTPTDLCVLRRIAEKTRASDYFAEHVSPLCHERQIDMASEIGLSAEQFRRIERKLEHLGLIRRDTGANGYRGGCAGADGTRIRAGLSLEPLIERLDALEELRAQQEAEKSRADGYRLEISMHRRRLGRVAEAHPDHPITKDILAAKASWKRPREYRSLSALAEHFWALEELVEKSADLKVEDPSWYQDMTGGAVPHDRCHIQYTTETNIESCNPPSNEVQVKRAACKQADMNKSIATPDGSAKCLEKKDVGSVEQSNSQFVQGLTLPKLLDLASEDMQLYIDIPARHIEPRSYDAIDYAVSRRCHEMGINVDALETAIQSMGELLAYLCVIVIDRNRFHPTKPIQNPGGALRAFIAAHKAGKLNIAGSVYGIWGRELEKHQAD